MKKTILCFLAALAMLSIAVYSLDVETESPNPLPPCENIGGFCQIGGCSPPYVNATLDGKCGELVTADEGVYRSADYNTCCKPEWVSSPDADGNIVCDGGSEYGSTTYPEGLRDIIPADRARCDRDGYLILYSDLTEGTYTRMRNEDFHAETRDACLNNKFVSEGSISGDITADSARKTVKIENGQFTGGQDICDAFGEYYRNKPTEFVIGGGTITISYAEMFHPRVTATGNAYILWGDIFFGCPKKDSSGRPVSCTLSAELESIGQGNLMYTIKYVNVNGMGFISERIGLETFNSRTPPASIEELKEKAPEGLVVIPLSNMDNIVLTKPDEQGSAYTITAKPAADGSSMLNYLKIKSSDGTPVSINAIGRRSASGASVITEEVEISPSDTTKRTIIDVTADATRVSEKKQAPFGVDAGCASAAGASRASVNVFVGDKKLAKAAICNSISIIPPLPAGASASLDSRYDSHSGQLTLNKEAREIKLRRDGNDYGNLELGMLPGYDKYVQTSAYHTDNDAAIICAGTPAVISVSNRPGNARLELSDDAVAIKPEGKLFLHLGFGFTASLCNTNTTKIETFECNAAGECTLDGTRVTGMMEGQQVGPALQSTRQANPQRAQRAAGEGQKAQKLQAGVR